MEGYCGVVVNVLDGAIIVSHFQLQSRRYVHFWIYTFEKGNNTLTPVSCGLQSKTTVLLQGWIWYEITREDWYAIKEKIESK